MGDSVDRIVEQWRIERPDLDPSPMGTVGRIKRAARILEQGISAILAQHDQQLWEFDLLATLMRSGPPYQLTAGALTDSAMITAGAMTNRVDRLVKRDLVSRKVDPENRRSILISLTERGRELVGATLSDHVANEARMLGALSAAEQEQLDQLLRKLLTSLGDTPSSIKTQPRARAQA
ncbi:MULTISPECIES: MarR family winged helix-turn-helix transcriptional regulator [Nocardia]|jgi:DNA-binding MarR family transcriptional regulator|uniref:MarR family transcriptional regulator n=2 Tax=Nocardia TaxID=1817 RepID=A0A2T2YUS6_9NOCA|nr:MULTISPECIES: MarR family transcriptional regulator [Nocardia]MBF6244621.1 MarR family transcriptional regulator [Nocardia elegans]MBF6451653.1 MarR family transcriptional regulator [Nocardia elegans]PSR59239.1 MarR family transcriptional regulator [Nocardia nova]